VIAEFDTYYIEAIQEKDAWNLCDFMVANEDRFKRFFPKTLEQTLTPDLSKQFCEKKVKQFHQQEEFLFTLKETETNTLVGLVYIKALDWIKKQGEFAYCIGYPFEGKGVTTKAIGQLSDYAFEKFKLKTLQIIAHKTNISSTKIASNCNFNWTKTLENEFTPQNEPPLNMELYERHNEG